MTEWWDSLLSGKYLSHINKKCGVHVLCLFSPINPFSFMQMEKLKRKCVLPCTPVASNWRPERFYGRQEMQSYIPSDSDGSGAPKLNCCVWEGTSTALATFWEDGCWVYFWEKEASAFSKISLSPGKQPKYYRAYVLACLNTAPCSVCQGFVHFPEKVGHAQADQSLSTCLPHQQDMG